MCLYNGKRFYVPNGEHMRYYWWGVWGVWGVQGVVWGLGVYEG